MWRKSTGFRNSVLHRDFQTPNYQIYARMIKDALKNQHIRTGLPTIATDITSYCLCLRGTSKKEKIWKEGEIEKYAVCDKQEHEDWEGRKRRMKLEIRVYFDCGYVLAYTWIILFEVQHSIHNV